MKRKRMGIRNVEIKRAMSYELGRIVSRQNTSILYLKLYAQNLTTDY